MERLPHRLAAVCFADIVDYSSLVRHDEDATLAMVQRLQSAAQESTRQHGGRVVKFTGDGVITEFPGTESAVRAALLLRSLYLESPAGRGSVGDLRIGVHIGEVATASDGDLYGDGVNTAARIQREAAPGQVLVSDDVRRQLRGRREFRFSAVGERDLKGTGRLALSIVDLAGSGTPAGPGASTDRQDAAAPSRSLRSVAVLPFVNISADAENEYFSDGMTEELINGLSRVPGLRVAARTSSFAFKSRSVDVREIGHRLGVSHVVEGSVRKAGPRLRITAQLVEVAGGYHLWSETFDRQLEDVFAIQDEISRAIVEALKIQLGDAEDASFGHQGTENAAAYTLYLKGRYQLGKRTKEAYRKALEHFEQAIELDDEYALAYSGLADAYCLLERYSVAPPGEIMPRARAAAERAVALGPALAAAHNSLAYARMMADWDWDGAAREFRRAVECQPRYAPTHHWFGWHLVQMGRLDEALEELQRALTLEPLSLIVNANVGTALYMMRRYADALEQLRKTLELDPNFVVAHQWRGRALEQEGRYAEAIADHERALELLGGDDPESVASLGHAVALAGRRENAEAALVKLEEIAQRQFVSRYWPGLVHLGLGRKEAALAELERARDERFDWVTFANVDPMFDSLRGEGRFQDLVRSMNLEPRG